MARDFVKEIAEFKARSTGDVSANYEINRLRAHWSESGKKDLSNDLVVIRLVTILEVAVRSWIAHLIDHGEPFLGRAERLFDRAGLKITFPTAMAITGKIVTIGDLIAHTIKVSSLTEVVSALSAVFGQDLKVAILTIKPAFPRESRSYEAPIVNDAEADFACLGKLFEIRHIIVHELPSERSFDLVDIDEFLSAASRFVEAIDLMIAEEIGDVAFTQAEMTEQAGARAKLADLQLQSILTHLNSANDDQELRAAQAAWETYRKLHADYASGINEPLHGTIAPMIWAMIYEDVTKQRIRDLEWRTQPD